MANKKKCSAIIGNYIEKLQKNDLKAIQKQNIEVAATNIRYRL